MRLARPLQTLLVALLPLTACQPRVQPDVAATTTRAPRPTLVVLLTVDQLGSDYFERYGRDFSQGLRRLRDEGATWSRGRHDHAIAETAPGHASTLSGRFPVSTGISSNSQGVRTDDSPLLTSSDSGASPFRFRGTTLFDWMRAADPGTRALSVSRKDRGAILPIGSARTEVYWYADNGDFTTSRYYRDTLPTWVLEFNDRRLAQAQAGRAWVPRYPPDRYPERDSVRYGEAGADFAFPHVVPRDPTQAAAAFRRFPWSDSITLAFALEGVRALGLGATAGRTDLLAVSLSATDAIGHRWGPESKEIHDQLLWLDQYVGQFLDELLAQVGRDRVIIAMTADHGIAPFPELRSEYYANGDAQRFDARPVWATVFDALRQRGVDTVAVEDDDGFRVVDFEAFRRAQVEPDEIARIWVTELRQLNAVLRADLLADLARADTIRDDIARRWLHMLPVDGQVRAVVTLKPFAYPRARSDAVHGQPHDYDTQVPVLFWGAGIVPGERTGEARVVDIGPTLAAWIGVRPLERVDGRVLTLRP